MADVGLDADLQLETRSALQAVDALERRLTAATNVTLRADASAITAAVNAAVGASDDEVTVTGRAEGVTGSIDSAVDAADDQVVVTGRTEGVTGAIDSAVGAADTEVTVTGEAVGITGAIDSAVDAADTHVTVTADASGLRQASAEADNLNSALIASSNSGLQLRTILQLGGVGAAAAGIQQVVQAASDLEQAVGGTTAVFGPAERQVSSFARGADEAAGLTEESARTLTSQIGGLLQGFDFTQREAAALSTELAQLGADLAATFGGTSQEAVQALGAALRGEFDPLERFGVSLNITQANLKAVELGLASSTSEVDANARAQGVLALIMERSANAQGQFARESDTTAGQLERLRAEAGNAAAEVGEELQPAINDLIAQGRGELIPALRDIAIALGPALATSVLALAPALGATTSLLSAGAPVIEAFASALDAIPDPVLQAIAVLVTLNRVSSLLGRGFDLAKTGINNVIGPTSTAGAAFRAAGGGAAGFRASIGSLAAGISPATFALAALVVGITAYSNAQAKKAAQARELAAQERAFQEALSGSEGAVDGLRGKLEDLVDTSADFEASTFTSGLLARGENFRTLFADAGATVDGFTEALAAGGPQLDRYLDALARAGGEDAAQSVFVLRDLATQLEEQARASIEAGIATDDYSQSQVNSAIESTKAADGSRNYIAALQQLQDQSARAAEQQEALASATTDANNAAETPQLNALGLTLEALQQRAGSVPRKFVDFALAADAAGLSGAELDAVAEQLGVSSEGLQQAISGTAGPILELADAAQQTIPSVSDLAGNIDEFSVTGFRDRLSEALTAVTEFQDNLQALADRPRLAAAAATLGPEFAAELGDAARQGKDNVLNEIELLLAGLEGEGVNLNNLITGEIGPNLVTGTGVVGQQMTDAFGTNFQPETEVRGSIRSTEGVIAGEGTVLTSAAAQTAINAKEGFRLAFGLAEPANSAVQQALDTIRAREGDSLGVGVGVGSAGTRGFGAAFTPQQPASDQLKRALQFITGQQGAARGAGAGVGQSGTSGFGSGLSGMSGQSVAQATRAKNTLDNFRGAFSGSGSSSGSAVTRGFQSGTSGMTAAGREAANKAIAAARAAGGGAHGAGSSVGSNLGGGVVSGINSQQGAVQAAANNLIAKAKAAMQAYAQIFSPSRLFRDDIGVPIAEGIAAGIDQGAGLAAAAAVAAVGQAASGANAALTGVSFDAPVAQVAPHVALAAASIAAGGTGAAGVAPIVIQNLTISLPAGTPVTEQAGRDFARGFRDTLAASDARVTARLTR